MKRAFLTNLGVTDSDTIKQIIDYHQGVVQDLKDDLSEVKTNLKTANADLKTANTTIQSLENESHDPDENEWIKKSEYDDLQNKYKDDIAAKQKEYDNLKETTETQKVIDTKKSLLESQLATDGANPKLMKLLMKEFDIDTIEIDGDKIKDWENISKPIKEQYADVFGTTTTVGVGVATPPANNATDKDPFVEGFED